MYLGVDFSLLPSELIHFTWKHKTKQFETNFRHLEAIQPGPLFTRVEEHVGTCLATVLFAHASVMVP